MGPERTWSVREGDQGSPVEHHRDRLVTGLQWRLVAEAGVGPGHGQAGSGVELDDGVGARSEVDHLTDLAGRCDLVGVEGRPGRGDPELLGPDGEVAVTADHGPRRVAVDPV